MTVTRRKQHTYQPYRSCNNSDTESINLGSAAVSDTESLHNEPVPFRPRRGKINESDLEELASLKKTTGKKKLRRYQNRHVLQTLLEDEDETESDLIEQYEGPFERLLNDSKALEFWNDFIDKSEEEQEKLLVYLLEKTKVVVKEAKPVNPFSKISAKIKRSIKTRLNLAKQLLNTIEFDVVGFFETHPELIYVKNPQTSFERLLIHAVAQFHDLKSISIIEQDKKLVQVENYQENWTPASLYLSSLISRKVR